MKNRIRFYPGWRETVFMILLFSLPAGAAFAAEVCPGVQADNSGASDASGAIQTCLNRLPPAGGGWLALPAGTYRVDHEIVLDRPATLTTSGAYGVPTGCPSIACASLRAGPNLRDAAILYGNQGAQPYVLDHLEFDGNRFARLNGAASLCAAGLARDVLMASGRNARIQFSYFHSALCGTGLGVALDPATPSPNLVVYQNVFADNGDHASGMWCDGLTIGAISNSYILYNSFYNNSDVSLILGGGSGSVISGNYFVQTWQANFASLMLTNWTVSNPQSSMQWADFRGLQITNNNFNLGDFSDIAIEVGVLPWGGSGNVGYLRAMGSRIAGNQISSNKQQINIAGGGVPGAMVDLGYNTYLLPGTRKPAGLLRSVPTTFVNIQNPWRDSFVSPEDTSLPLSAYDWSGVY